ncbi:hypothetical protein GFB49_12960 [Epibacterium sp. SM1979]|uniref:Uncharacterized protein n=1 Tax=Tritonibacter litoralis TaxID=2662264 RepID=A0A843YDB5_9RHOB|nr:hypothetical protein [Tritonibacter litoralis]MQQ09370.1 hypothetical protein [Tritonibacter litoralis]
MLPSNVPVAVLIQMTSGAPTSPTPPLPGPLRAPRGRRIELPTTEVPFISFDARDAFGDIDPFPPKQAARLH